jgi:hypothetical protein
MKTRSIALRLALALTLWHIAILLLTAPCGPVRDLRGALRNQRRSLCETIALSSSLLASHQDWTGMERNLREIAARHPEVRSAAVRTADGRLLTAIGHHAAWWPPQTMEDSTAVPMHVPIFAGDQPWGTVELRLADASGQSAGSWWHGPLVRQALTMALSSGAMLFLVFWAVLRRLDPTATITQLAATRAELTQAREELRCLRQSAAMAQESPAGHSPWLPSLDEGSGAEGSGADTLIFASGSHWRCRDAAPAG